MARTLDKSLEKPNLEREIRELFPDANDWRQRGHEQLGGMKPDELLDGSDEQREQLRNLLEAIKHGMVS